MTSPQERAAEIDRLMALADDWVVAAIHAAISANSGWPTEAKPEKASATLRAALEAALADADKLRDVLLRNGFVRCDIAACNCGSWHARYGYPERFAELRSALAEAGHQTCNENGNLVSGALRELISERDALRAAKDSA